MFDTERIIEQSIIKFYLLKKPKNFFFLWLTQLNSSLLES